jgi:hypothetical protein
VTKIYASHIKEPDLVFGRGGEEKDPKLGLKHFGPYVTSDEKPPFPMQIRVGIVGTGETITLAKRIVKSLGKEIKSNEDNRWLYPDYPGFSLDNETKCKFVTSKIWNEIIKTSEIQNILSIIDPNERIAAGVDLFVDKIEQVNLEDSLLQVILCALPIEIEEYCGVSERTRGAKGPKFTALEKEIAELKREGQKFLIDWIATTETDVEEQRRSYDFRNALKGKAMRFNVPTQILRESTARSILEYPDSTYKVRQGPAPFAWNFSTGLYYKAHGRPWRLAKLTVGTCYIGISFYQNRLNPELNLETSMAQIFTHSGEGFVLRGSDVVVDRFTRQPRLTKAQAFDLLNDCIEKYSKKVGTAPRRVVIHKTSLFSNDECKGFDEAIGELQKDYAAISMNTDLRFLRTGKYPVLRGTVVSLTANQCLLFTAGYTPRIRTYPGHRVPRPLLITHHGDSEMELICSEIMGLTKLDWNTTTFSKQLPITLGFAHSVGKVLSELPKSVEVKDHYRFYM